MPQLTEEGQNIVAEVAQRHGFSIDAVTHMLVAVSAGHGTQAQFNHPEFGGMGQWSQGGMTMIGDMFNNFLKAKVDGLCADLSNIVRNHSLFTATASSQSQSQGGAQNVSGVSLFVQDAPEWPSELGQPSSVGTQNDVRYAYFPDQRRLAIKIGGQTNLYDTGEHQIGGFAQSQGGGQSLSFTSQLGLIQITDLPLINGDFESPVSTVEPQISADPLPPTEAIQPEPAFQPAPAYMPTPASTPLGAIDDEQIFSRIERLAELFKKGILTEAEFETKKAELLARL